MTLLGSSGTPNGMPGHSGPWRKNCWLIRERVLCLEQPACNAASMPLCSLGLSVLHVKHVGQRCHYCRPELPWTHVTRRTCGVKKTHTQPCTGPNHVGPAGQARVQGNSSARDGQATSPVLTAQRPPLPQPPGGPKQGRPRAGTRHHPGVRTAIGLQDSLQHSLGCHQGPSFHKHQHGLLSRLHGPSGALCGACASSGEKPAHTATCLPGPRNNCTGGRAGAPRQQCSAPHALLELQRRRQHSETGQGSPAPAEGQCAFVCVRSICSPACPTPGQAPVACSHGRAPRRGRNLAHARAHAGTCMHSARPLRTPGQQPDARDAPRRSATAAAAFSWCAYSLATCPRSWQPAQAPVNARPGAHASAHRWHSLSSPSCMLLLEEGPASIPGAQAA